jgi:hypothetical protein
MKIISNPKTLPDGRVCQYHRITEVIFPETLGEMKVLLGSWTTLEAASSQAAPEAVTAIDMTYSGSRETATDGLIERIMQTPDWAGSELLDSSKPETKEELPQPEIL